MRSDRMPAFGRAIGRAGVLAVALLLGASSAAWATVSTDKPDYAPGSVVTISGDNSNGAGYVSGNTVHVIAAKDDGTWTAACDPEPIVGPDGAWSCGVTLSADPDVAVGSYTYTATQVDASGNVVGTEQGTFTDALGVSHLSLDVAPNPAATGQAITLSGRAWAVVLGKIYGVPYAAILLTGPYANSDCINYDNPLDHPVIWAGLANSTGYYTASGTAPATAGDYWYHALSGTFDGQCTKLTVTLSPGSVSIANIPAAATFGGSFTPTFSKLGTGATSVTTQTPSTCTVDSGTGQVRYIGVGICTLQAHVTADGTYAAADGSPQGFSIGRADARCDVVGWSGPYDGQSHGATGSCTGVNGEALVGLSLGDGFTDYPGGAAHWTFAGNANYNGLSGDVAIDIAKVALTITASNGTMVMGGTPPTITPSYSGFVNGETSAVLSTQPTCGTAADGSSPVGSYASSCSGATARNYTFTYVPGTVRVTYAPAGASCLDAPAGTILQPVDADGGSIFKQGSTIPLKFRVCDTNGTSIGSSGVVTAFWMVQKFSGTEEPTVNEPIVSTTPDTAFRWDATGQQWIFNLNTKNLSKGFTYVYRITLNDGTSIVFQFGLR